MTCASSGSGPRCGFGELLLPENEPGSSIMPGKVNPTQCEALTMVCCAVLGHQATIGMAASQGHLELNAYKPVIAERCCARSGFSATRRAPSPTAALREFGPIAARIAELVERSLMLVTALAPKIGYDKAAAIAKAAHANGTTLRQEALALGYVTPAQFDALVRPEAMATPA